MSGVVVDASVALAWCFEDETSGADHVLIELRDFVVLVPPLWSLELANVMLVGERKKRLGPMQIERFTSLLQGL